MSANPPSEAIAAAVSSAVRLMRAGDAGEAERLFRAVLAMDGTVGAAWARLGGLALGDGRAGVAARCFARLASLEPDRATALHNLGEAMRLDGRRGQARSAFRRALRLRPDYALAAAALGWLDLRDGRRRAAQRALVRAVTLDPGLSAAWHGLGRLVHGRVRPDAVTRMIRRAARLAPQDPAVQAALGMALAEEGRLAPAGDGVRRAAALAPGEAGHCGCLAGVLMRKGDADGALALTRRVRRIDPTASEADAIDSQLHLLGGDFRRADALARRALALAPGNADNLINAGLVSHSLRRLDEARAWDERALRLDPGSHVARFNLSMTLLALGDFARGWPLYEARWRMEGAAFPDHAPAWDGSPPAGRTILLTGEQGHGDTLHFARYAPLLAAAGARVVLHVQPGLKRLLALMHGVAAVAGFDEPPPPADACAPLMSVPGLVGTRLDTVPAAPYLRAAEADRPAWRDRLKGERRLKVGLVWAGEPRAGDFKAGAVDRRRSLPLAALAPLAAVPGVAFYSLQKGEAARQTPPPGLDLVDWMDAVGDFADTAALVEQLDLVITVDTSMCHLAGGLGRPVWVLSRFDACWRWLDNREDSPWYPTMRLFHQDAPGAWGPVVERVAAELRTLARAQAPAGDLAADLAAAIRLHRAGRLSAAAAVYRSVLAADPAGGDALHLLGLVAQAHGRPDEAGRLFDRAIRVDAGAAIVHNSLAEHWRAAGQAERAVLACRRALALQPGYADAQGNLAKLRQEEGDYRRAVRLRSGDAELWRALGDVVLRLRRPDEAEALHRRALALRPDFAEAHNNLGSGLVARRRFAEARAPYRRAIALNPGYPDPWNNLASALWETGEAEAAMEHYERCVALKPDHPDGYANLGYARRAHPRGARDYAVAEAACRRALALNPGHVPARNNLGIVQLDGCRLAEAQATFRSVLAAVPENADARFNLSLALLKDGRWEEGWREYEWRWRTGQLPPPNLTDPPWRGEPLEGRTILLHAEQGHGDTLHFVRYAPLVAARGGRVVLAVQKALKRLLTGMPGVEAVYELNEPIPAGFALHCPLLGLPLALGTTVDTVPAAVPYLHPDPAAVARWKARLAGDGRLKVGLAWSGDPRRHAPRANAVDRRRSLTLDALAPLAAAGGGVVFYSLQKGEPAAQAKQPPAGLELVDLMDEAGDFADTAALVATLDLVITVDTSVAHLAGGLGVPTWVLSRFDGCWRWLMDRDDTPWYPTMRLFRQDTPGDWDPVVERVAAALKALAPTPRPRRRPLSGRLALRDVTVVCADTRTHAASLRALERCRVQGDFARVVFFTDADPAEPGIERVAIPRLDGREAYSRFLLKDLVHHVDTPFVLVVQWDGFITDPSRWCDEFRRYDYIGARWPWHADGMQVGNGGFSLRSMRLLRALQDPRITDVRHEDASIGRRYRRHLEAEHGIAFAPPETADRFAYERSSPREPTFGFHGLFNVWRHMGRDELLALLAELPPAVLTAREGRELAKALAALGRMEELAALRRRAGAPHESLIEEATPGRA
ncbi:DUF5672 family protein [Azospirillum sp.]|uniref:DUF5672 family protein n=1 Tax=Azospirillum sp. TaxID=34012 RepID=UPI002D307DD9|nr:DUF5672 family protein [Azospirillum sp.]HYD71398.1 DUF5672 family protein [Azospirillum sp.]